MNGHHLNADDLELYVDKELNERSHNEIDSHLADCSFCRGRMMRAARIDNALRTLPRYEPASDLAARIGSAVEVHLFQDRLRRSRMPFIVVATFFSLLLLLWFGLQMIIALEENGTLDFVSILTSRPDILSAYSADAIWALIEALPLGEIALTLFSLFTVIVLAQQWVDTIRPHTSYS